MIHETIAPPAGRTSEPIAQTSDTSDDWKDGESTGEDGEHGTLEPRARAERWTDRFLRSLTEKKGHVHDACRAANVSRQTAYARKATDAEFCAAWDAILDGVVDDIEHTGVALAAAGSERLVEFMLRTRRRPTYGERLDVTVAGAVLHVTPDDVARTMAAACPELVRSLALAAPEAAANPSQP